MDVKSECSRSINRIFTSYPPICRRMGLLVRMSNFLSCQGSTLTMPYCPQLWSQPELEPWSSEKRSQISSRATRTCSRIFWFFGIDLMRNRVNRSGKSPISDSKNYVSAPTTQETFSTEAGLRYSQSNLPQTPSALKNKLRQISRKITH